MSAFYDLASLVVVPSGYKSGKIYAQKPLTTDGQLTFSRASTATRVNASGLIETVASNVPRLDYLGSTCPKLQLEPQRSNLCTYSSAFDNAVWVGGGVTVTANTVTSPDGTLNADTFTETAATEQHGKASALISFTSGTTYTFSAFAKNAPSGRGFVQLYGYQLGSGAADVFANFNLNTGVVGTATGGTSTITNYGNGWYRCTFTFTCGTTQAERINLVSVTSASATAGQNYAGDITKSIYWYGAQVEAGAYPTSLINTTTAAVTRLADAAYKTGISSLIGQTEGTAFIDLTITKPDTGNADFLLLENTATPTNGVYVLFMHQTGQIGLFSYPSSTFAYVNSVDYSGQRIKVAYAYSATGLYVWINGSQVYSNGSVSLGTGMSTFGLNNPQQATISTNARIFQSLLFKTRLTNAQLAELTTL